MSRIYKKLLPEEEEGSEPIELENPVEVLRPHLKLVVSPPPPTARMLAPLIQKRTKRKTTLIRILFLLGLGAGGKWYLSHPQVWSKSQVSLAKVEKPVSSQRPAENLSEDLAQQREAMRLFQKSDFAGAKLRFEKLVEFYPESTELLNDLALSYFKLNEFSQARKFYTRALKISPADPVTLNNLGAYSLSQKDFIQAASFFKRALVIKPELLEAHLNLAIALELSGNMLGAVPEYEFYLQSPLARNDLKPLLQRRMEKIKSFSAYYLKHAADELVD